MSTTKFEPTAQQIKDEKLYAGMGMSDEEFAMVEGILGRLPNWTETGLFSVMWSEHCSYKNSKPVLRKFPTKGPQVFKVLVKVQGLSILVTSKLLSLKWNPITTLQQLSRIKGQQQV